MQSEALSNTLVLLRFLSGLEPGQVIRVMLCPGQVGLTWFI